MEAKDCEMQLRTALMLEMHLKRTLVYSHDGVTAMNFSREMIVDYLSSYAPISSFYVFRSAGSDVGLIKFYDSSWRSWNVMEDDEALAAQALAFLYESGAPVIEDMKSLLKYEAELAARSDQQP